MLSARPPRNAEGKRPDSFRHSLSVRPRLRSTEECKERGRGTWSFKSLNPSRRALQFSPPAFSAFLSKLGDGFILHHQNSPPAVSGHTCARGSAHPTYYCRVDSMYRQLDCPRPRKRSCLLQSHW